MKVNYWQEFQKHNHKCPELDKLKFESLQSWDFGWFLLEPINAIQSDEQEVVLTKGFSPGQKALPLFED